MRILHVNKAYDTRIGGIERALQVLAEEQSRWAEVEVLACNDGPRTEVTRVNSRLTVRKVASLATLLRTPLSPTFPLHLRARRADIIHFHHPAPLVEFSYLLSRPPGRVVVSWHSDILRPSSALAVYRPFLLRLLRRADRIFASSPAYLEASPFLRAFRERCLVIPYGIDLELFSPARVDPTRREELRARYGPNLVLFVGRLVYYKGLSHLIEAMRQIQGRLVAIGRGPLEAELRRQAEALGLEGRIDFLPPVSDQELVNYYGACDLFVLPSIYKTEAFGLVQLEAMALGKPVVSTNLPTGVPYVNQHGVTGLVVPPADPQALAAAINALLSDPERRQRYGAAGRRRVEEQFSKGLYARRMLQAYEELLRERGS